MSEIRRYIGHGEMLVLEGSSGYRNVGNVSEVMASIAVEQTELKEHKTGELRTVKTIQKNLSGTLQITLDDWVAENLALGLYGGVSTVTGASVSAEESTAFLGRYIKLNNINISSFTSLTNASGATTYVAGTDYKVDLKLGTVEILSTGAIPNNSAVEANYTHGGAEKITAFSALNRELNVLFLGLNSADDDTPVRVEIYKFKPDPIQDLGFLNANHDQATLTLSGQFFYDPSLDDGTTATSGYMQILQTV